MSGRREGCYTLFGTRSRNVVYHRLILRLPCPCDRPHRSTRKIPHMNQSDVNLSLRRIWETGFFWRSGILPYHLRWISLLAFPATGVLKPLFTYLVHLDLHRYNRWQTKEHRSPLCIRFKHSLIHPDGNHLIAFFIV